MVRDFGLSLVVGHVVVVDVVVEVLNEVGDTWAICFVYVSRPLLLLLTNPPPFHLIPSSPLLSYLLHRIYHHGTQPQPQRNAYLLLAPLFLLLKPAKPFSARGQPVSLSPTPIQSPKILFSLPLNYIHNLLASHPSHNSPPLIPLSPSSKRRVPFLQSSLSPLPLNPLFLLPAHLFPTLMSLSTRQPSSRR